jgi:ribonuclease J
MPADLDPAALHFLPLGGTGEIGMNLNLYAFAGQWLMVDCGVMFRRDGLETQAWLPDIQYIAARRDALAGLVITHAHQDHLGAVRDLWPSLRCPVYATPFAAAMLRDQLAEAGLQRRVPIRLLEEKCHFRVGPFDLERIPLTHSTVEMGALVIRTPAGSVLHTGDFKLDPDPVVGQPLDEGALRALASQDIDAVVADSTNADEDGWTGSEASVIEPLRAILRECKGRVAVSCFASNVARLHTLAQLAAECGRHAVLMGRSMDRTVRAAQATGYLVDTPPLVSPRDFGFLPPERTLLLCTGSQGEPRAALSRLAEDSRSDVYLEAGDTVVLSARVIPGNELFVERLARLFTARGIQMVRGDDVPIHVSGHPRRGELCALYRWVAPKVVVPTHGTPAKLEAHAALAESMGLPAHRCVNGEVIRLCPGPAARITKVLSGRIQRVESKRPRRRGPPKW